MATKTITTGYGYVSHVVPSEVLDLAKLAEMGGRVVEEFTVQIQRKKLETDDLTRIEIPADKIGEFGGLAVDLVDGKWVHTPVEKEAYAITEEVEIPEPEIPDAPEVLRDAPKLVEATPQRFVRKSDYESLIEATEAATTVKALKEVLASYFALRAGL